MKSCGCSLILVYTISTLSQKGEKREHNSILSCSSVNQIAGFVMALIGSLLAMLVVSFSSQIPLQCLATNAVKTGYQA